MNQLLQNLLCFAYVYLACDILLFNIGQEKTPRKENRSKDIDHFLRSPCHQVRFVCRLISNPQLPGKHCRLEKQQDYFHLCGVRYLSRITSLLHCSSFSCFLQTLTQGKLSLRRTQLQSIVECGSSSKMYSTATTQVHHTRGSPGVRCGK